MTINQGSCLLLDSIIHIRFFYLYTYTQCNEHIYIFEVSNALVLVSLMKIPAERSQGIYKDIAAAKIKETRVPKTR